MTTPAEQEAERRYPDTGRRTWTFVEGSDSSGPGVPSMLARRADFVDGAEWSESRYRELLEAAREYRDARNAWALEEDTNTRSLGTSLRVTQAEECLLAAAAALEEA